jgi:hypothetical protein
MFAGVRHWRGRELRFLGLVAITVGLMALYLNAGLRLAQQEGSGWRTINLEALQRRVESGELSDHEARWYHLQTEAPKAGAEGAP